MALIEPLHRNKPNITKSYLRFHARISNPGSEIVILIWHVLE